LHGTPVPNKEQVLKLSDATDENQQLLVAPEKDCLKMKQTIIILNEEFFSKAEVGSTHQMWYLSFGSLLIRVTKVGQVWPSALWIVMVPNGAIGNWTLYALCEVDPTITSSVFCMDNLIVGQVFGVAMSSVTFLFPASATQTSRRSGSPGEAANTNR
jgi:hypothetical protein